MNKNTITVFFILFISTITSATFSQWQADVQLTFSTAPSYTTLNSGWCIAASGNLIHTVWSDQRSGNFEIYYKRSTDAGITWEPDTRLSFNEPYTSSYTVLCISGPYVHVVWQDDRHNQPQMAYEIYYIRSTDYGVSWGPETRLTNKTGNSSRPVVAAAGSNVNVVWHDDRNGNKEIYYKRSTDNGTNWGTDFRLTNNSGNRQCPSISISGTDVHVAWWEERDNNPEIYYKRSTDNGINWGIDTRLTNYTDSSYFPCISVSGQNVHVVWIDTRDGNEEIYYKRSTNSGTTWGTDNRLTYSTALSTVPNIAVSGPLVHLIWREHRDGNPEIYYKHTTNNGANWDTDTRLTYNSANSEYPSIAFSGSMVHAIWYDYREGNAEIYYKQNPTGNLIGITNISSEIPKTFSLSQNFPNPFNPSTKIRFDVAKQDFVSIKIYDVLGREIAILVSKELKPGTYEVDWSIGLLSENASDYTSGVYFYCLQTEGFKETKRMLILK